MPDDAAYGRVTNPERYRPLHAVADALVEDLRASYDVAVDDDPDEREWLEKYRITRAVRLSPASGGAPLLIGWTEFPGVVIRFGRSHTAPFPTCGCDACDEQVDDLRAELLNCTEAVTTGGYVEWTGKGGTAHEFIWSSGTSSGWASKLNPRKAERIDWPAW